MSSLIFNTTARILEPLLLLFSIFVLLRGHNEPGGGFVGGLVASAAFALRAITAGPQVGRQDLRVDPHRLLGGGLLLAAASGAVSLLLGQPFLTGQWAVFNIPIVGELALSTPLLFDIGVYLVVIGTVLLIVFTLAEEEP